MSAGHDAAHDDGHHVHVTPLKHYFGVFGILLVLTVVTVWIAKFDFGAANTFIAMFVATVKASLVAAVFMHLLYDERLNSLAFVFGLLFVALFFIFTLTDVMTRGNIDPLRDNLTETHDRTRQLALQAEQADDIVAKYPKRTVAEDYPTAADERVNPPVVVATVPPAVPESAAEGAEGAAPAVPAFEVDAAKAEKGKALYASKTCSACHSIDGTRLVGPSLKGFWGRKPKLEGGLEALGDQAYFIESVRNPNAKVNEGYPPAMPAGLPVSDEELDLILHYINSL
jgi:cytochrome c oxidase subunit 4